MRACANVAADMSNSISEPDRAPDTRHRDHDARFFKLLGQVMPDWEQRKQRLEAALL